MKIRTAETIFKQHFDESISHSISRNQFSNAFLHHIFFIFFILKIWVPKPYTHPSRFSNFWPTNFLHSVPICSWTSYTSENWRKRVSNGAYFSTLIAFNQIIPRGFLNLLITHLNTKNSSYIQLRVIDRF